MPTTQLVSKIVFHIFIIKHLHQFHIRINAVGLQKNLRYVFCSLR